MFPCWKLTINVRRESLFVTDLLWETMTHFPVGQTRRAVRRGGRSLWKSEHTLWKPLSFDIMLLLYFRGRDSIYSFRGENACLHSRLPTGWNHDALTNDTPLPLWRVSPQRFGWKLHRHLATNMFLYHTTVILTFIKEWWSSKLLKSNNNLTTDSWFCQREPRLKFVSMDVAWVRSF